MRASPILFSALWALPSILSSPPAFSEETKKDAAAPAAVAAATTPAPAPASAEAKPPAAAEAKPACAADAKDPSLHGCTKALETVTAGLKDAYYGFRQWTAEASAQMEALEKKDADLQAKLTEVKTQEARLNAEAEKAEKKRKKEISKELKQLAKDGKQLNKEIAGVGKEKSRLCSALSKTAGQKVKEIVADLKTRLDQTQDDIKK